MDHETLTEPAPQEAADLFTYQQRAFPLLLAWSVGSVLAGWLWRRPRAAFWRGIGDQFIGWGSVDALIASFGLRGARRNAVLRQNGQMDSGTYTRQRRNFSLIIGLNIILDLGYMLVGRSVINQSQEDYRRGMGWGILVQGGFLFIWDVLLLLFIPEKRRGHEP
jgi:hypothetical protein